MSWRVALMGLIGLGLALTPPGPSADRPIAPGTPQPPDDSALETALHKDDADAALDALRERTPRDAERIATLIRRLGDDSFEDRERAVTDLIALGRPAAGPLRRAARGADPEIAARASRCLRALPPSRLAAQTALLIARRKPAGAVEVLLAYLPYAEDEAAEAAAREALVATSFPDGKPAPAVLAALEDAEPVRRAAAAEVLAPLIPDAVRPLLRDPVLEVRERAARALLTVKEREAVPALIALLPDLPPDAALDLEAMLHRLADGAGPPAVLTGKADDARRCRNAWSAWWDRHAKAVDLSRVVPPASKGRTLLAVMDVRSSSGRIAEIDRDHKLPWVFDDVEYPVAVQYLGDKRVLVAESRTGRLTERDRDGKVLWQAEVSGPIVSAERLPDGTTLVATRNRLLVVDREGKATELHRRPTRDLLAARRYPDGHIALVLHDGTARVLDTTGNETSRFALGGIPVFAAGVDTSPGRRLLVPLFAENKVEERDAEGRLLWEAKVVGPTAVRRLPNGNALVASTTTRQVLEVDRLGRAVWSYTADRGILSLDHR